jgi:hypothetical protein
MGETLDLFKKDKNEKGYIDWGKTGLLEGISEKNKWHMMFMLDIVYNLLENDKTNDGQFETVVFAIVRRIYSSMGIIINIEEREKIHYYEKVNKFLDIRDYKYLISKKHLGDRLKNLAIDIYNEYRNSLKDGKFFIEDTPENRLTYDVEAENAAHFCEQYVLKNL